MHAGAGAGAPPKPSPAAPSAIPAPHLLPLPSSSWSTLRSAASRTWSRSTASSSLTPSSCAWRRPWRRRCALARACVVGGRGSGRAAPAAALFEVAKALLGQCASAQGPRRRPRFPCAPPKVSDDEEEATADKKEEEEGKIEDEDEKKEKKEKKKVRGRARGGTASRSVAAAGSRAPNACAPSSQPAPGPQLAAALSPAGLGPASPRRLATARRLNGLRHPLPFCLTGD
jgi:hypothetical protein